MSAAIAIAAIAVLVTGSIFWLMNSAMAQTNTDQTSQNSQAMTEQDWLDYMGKKFDIMNTFGLNPGVMMGGNEMSRDDYLAYLKDMYDLKSQYMNQNGWGMMGSGWGMQRGFMGPEMMGY